MHTTARTKSIHIFVFNFGRQCLKAHLHMAPSHPTHIQKRARTYIACSYTYEHAGARTHKKLMGKRTDKHNRMDTSRHEHTERKPTLTNRGEHPHGGQNRREPKSCHVGRGHACHRKHLEEEFAHDASTRERTYGRLKHTSSRNYLPLFAHEGWSLREVTYFSFSPNNLQFATLANKLP